MIFLPVAERELRVRARQKATFRTRVGAALAGCLIIGFFLVSQLWRLSPAAMGKAMFWFLSGLVFLWCLLEGPRNTADALSEEKREGTLGLLFLTDLKGYDVVLGKLLATSLNSIYGILAVVPPLSIPLLLGGVTGGEFWRMTLLLVVTLIFSLSAGMLISANSRNERRAWFGAVGLVGSLAIISPAFSWMPLPATKLFGLISPTAGFYGLEDSVFARRPETFWYAVGGTHALSWGFFIAACLVLPRSWQDKPVQRANREVRGATRLLNASERPETIHLNPVVWLLTRGRRADWYVWAVIAIVALPSVALAFSADFRMVFLPGFIVVAVMVNLLLAVWVSAKACFMIGDARGAGVLDLLLTTPINPRQIIDGHMAALKRQFMQPFVVFTVTELVVVALAVGHPRDAVAYPKDALAASGELALALLITALAAGLFAAQLISAAWFGLWCGLTTKKSAHAVVKTVLWVVVIPLFFGVCWCFWPVVAIVKDAILISYARSSLFAQFRTIVTEGLPAKKKPMTWRPVPESGLAQ